MSTSSTTTKRRKPLWARTAFGKWVHARGGPRVARELSERLGYPVTTSAVYGWLSGKCYPKPRHIAALMEISNNAFTLGDILEHAGRRQLRPQPETELQKVSELLDLAELTGTLELVPGFLRSGFNVERTGEILVNTAVERLLEDGFRPIAKRRR